MRERPVPLRAWCFKACSIGVRRLPAETRMRPLAVVVVAPSIENDARVRQRAEQGLIQQLVAQTLVEAFDEGVLDGFSGAMWCQPTWRSSAQRKMAFEVSSAP